MVSARREVNFNTEVLRCVLEIEKAGSISRASQNLFVSQPNLSASVKNLEKTLGYMIFSRSSTGVTATEQGRLFLDSARIIVSELENMRKVPDLFAADKDGLSIVSVYSVAILNRFILFRNEHEGSGRNDLFKETGLRDALNELIEKRYRIGFLYEFDNRLPKLWDMAQRYNLEVNLLYPDIAILAIVSKRHPLAKLSEISIDTLVTTPLVTYEYLKDAEWMDAMGLEHPRDILYVSDRGGMLEILSYGHHVGISIGRPFLNTESDHLVAIPIIGVNRKVNQYWVKPAGYQLTHAEDQFLRFVKNVDFGEPYASIG